MIYHTCPECGQEWENHRVYDKCPYCGVVNHGVYDEE